MPSFALLDPMNERCEINWVCRYSVRSSGGRIDKPCLMKVIQLGNIFCHDKRVGCEMRNGPFWAAFTDGFIAAVGRFADLT